MKGNCSIIIPTFNRAQELKKLLQNLLLQTVLEQIEEVIICDSNSQDETSIILENFKEEFNPIKILHLQTENNISKKRNLGINNASTDNLIFFDDDCEPKKDCVEKHLLSLDGSVKSIFSGTVKFPIDQVISNNYIRYRDSRHRFFDSYTENDELDFKEIVTMNMSLKKDDLFKESLFFDESFMGYGMEDNEFAFRAKKQGFRLLMTKAEIIHHDWHDLNTYRKKIYSTAKNGTAHFLEKSPEAVWEFYYSKLLEPDYPNRKNIHKFIGFLLSLLLNKNIANLLAYFLRKTNSISFLYSNLLFRYILAYEYRAGINHRNERFKTIEDTKDGFY